MITLSYMDILIALLLIVAIIAVVVLIVVLVKTVKVMNNLEVVSQDAAEISATAKEAMNEVNKTVVDVEASAKEFTNSLGEVCKLMNGNRNTISAVTNLTNAIAGLANMFKK